MILYHGTTEKRAREITQNGWDSTVIFYASISKDFAAGFARRAWLGSTEDNPAIIVFEISKDDVRYTNLSLTYGEVIINNPTKIKILNVEVLDNEM